MMSGLLSGALIFSAQEWEAIIFGAILWFASIYILRLMAKSDPKLRSVYIRHRKYKAYYPARSTPFRENSKRQGDQYR